MQIDKEHLIELVADKSGLDKGEVKKQLAELIDDIRQSADKGENFEIKGFGTFKVVDEKLRFYAADNLKTEINHKYAGMQPIELIGAVKDTPDVAVDGDTPEEASEPEEMEELADIEEGAPTPDSSKDSETEEPQAPETVEPEIPKEIPEPVAEDDEGSSFEFDSDASEEDEEVEQEEEPEPEPEPVLSVQESFDSKRASYSRDDEDESDHIGRFLVAAVIVVAIGASGWFVYDFGLLDSFLGNGSSNTNPTEETVQNAGPPSTVGQDKKPAEESMDTLKSGSEQNEDNSVPKSVSVAEQSKGSIYGLRGGAVPQAEAGYTIVVHSLRSKSKAEEMEQSLKSEGYVTILTSGVVGGVTRWRVGLGQFKNVEDAQKAIGDLPASYRQNNFIRKF